MRIGIDAHILGKGKGGVERVVHQMVRLLPDLQPDDEFVIFVNRRYVPPFPTRQNVRFRSLPISEPLVQRSLILPWMARRENLDILHVQRAAPFTSRSRLVVHVHDLLPLTARQDHQGFRDQIVRRLIPSSLRKADRVLTVSRSVADEIASLFPDVAEKVVAIPNGVDAELFQPKAADAPRAGIHGRLDLRGEYVLYLGALMERKNLEVAILGFQQFLQRRAAFGEAGRFQFVLAGMCRSGAYAERLRNLAAHTMSGAIRFAGFISDTDCTALLQHASAFLAPSRGEGFDLPALEAMACAVPVLCSDIPVHRELLGEDAVFFPPDEPEKMAVGLLKLLDQPDLRAHLEMQGPKRAFAFNWKDSMRRLGDLYRGLGKPPFCLRSVVTFREFRELVASDIDRFIEHTDSKPTFRTKLSVFFMPSIQAIFTYRLARYLYLRGWRFIPRIMFTLNLILWGTDITPQSKIGRGFYMPHTVGVTIFAVLGERCTCYAQAAIGGGSGNETDIGAGPGLPVLGDGVMVGARAMIVGPIRVASGSMIGANAFVTFDVPENSTVVAQGGSIL